MLIEHAQLGCSHLLFTRGSTGYKKPGPLMGGAFLFPNHCHLLCVLAGPVVFVQSLILLITYSVLFVNGD